MTRPIPFFSFTKDQMHDTGATRKGMHSGSAPLIGHAFGLIDAIAIMLGAACIIANEFITIGWIRWTLIAACILALPFPAILQKEKAKRQFGLGSVFRLFRKMGLNPSIEGNEINWEFQGKRNSIRINHGCQVQIYREYPAPADMIGKFESAASITMDEVFSAKVGVHRNGENPDNIFFSTELLCSSMKEFHKLLAASVGILDTAEERQRANIQELFSADKEETHRIGFQ